MYTSHPAMSSGALQNLRGSHPGALRLSLLLAVLVKAGTLLVYDFPVIVHCVHGIVSFAWTSLQTCSCHTSSHISACSGETSGEYDSRVIASGVLADLITLFHSRHESERQVSPPPMHVLLVCRCSLLHASIWKLSGSAPVLLQTIPSIKSMSGVLIWQREAC
jgi:hypothetical protein